MTTNLNYDFKFKLYVVDTSDTRGLKLKIIRKKKSVDKKLVKFSLFFSH